MTDIERIREAAGCTRQCALSDTYSLTASRIRFTHNGVGFSHAVDVDPYMTTAYPDETGGLLARWCKEHHAGRSGHEIPIEQDGRTLLIPEAVG